MPWIASIGPDLPSFEPAAVELPLAHSTVDATVPIGVLPESAAGYHGRPGLVGARPDGRGWSPRFSLDAATSTAASARFELSDPTARLGLVVDVAIDDVVTISAELVNRGDAPYEVQRLAPTIPVPAHAGELLTFGGRWCRELQPRRSPFVGSHLIENRTGRSSQVTAPGLFVGTPAFGEQHGEVWGVQLAWSGGYALAAETLPDGRRVVQAGELLSPGEVILEPGERYTSPDVVIAWSPSGMTPVSQRFHRYARAQRPRAVARPVVLNTWEAVYFDHDLDRLRALADVAAEVGVERFVLDDGWFGARRDEHAGLGDWWVSETAWPTGLTPLIDHVVALGMDFGLWVEPEMVNPDSDLFRAHPEWTLTTAGYEPLLGRHQLVLDCGRPEVRDHLFDALDTLLTDHEISHLKWDMNRDVVQGSHDGRPGLHGHTVGVYELIDRLRAAHPGVEIESCASGGGRVDLGILRRTDRVWTSDCNDALERQLIQRGCSMLVPPEVMGAHIGPERAHTTGRRHDLGFRAATALFGHLGIEWNLLDTDDEQREEIAAAVALHRRLRPLLHHGDVVRYDHPDPALLAHGVVAPDRSRAIVACVQLQPSAAPLPAPLRLPGLADDGRYRLACIDDVASARIAGRTSPRWTREPITVHAAQLAHTGLQLPIQHPESVLLLELERVDG